MTLYSQDCYTNRMEPFNLRALRGQVLLIVNVASRCGYTPQLEELEWLYRRYRDQGFTVLAFPCNQFGRQTPESAEGFGAFCAREYRVSFPIMEKVRVNGREAHPLFTLLRRQAPGVLGSTPIKWNFTKFLVGRDGHVIRRFSPRVSPRRLTADIERALDIPFSA
ncbi:MULTISPECIES: glutathione peroxidase [Chromohalobacter]|uniref:Glutathione peroxidase n=1 Tax=Chromohalobacter israelensis (strain ATCC BAA-138 / DSM 3043 / CIP 106854 / NCIMB 13768 / 1H11) TaxID=290398 RepID=Q1QTN7_CHRI1|nr:MULTISPECIES: glutathione peroxidase [Chromohalobacter]ABE60171.1 Glutathione peroxidase [Chromohalobacter salexigens DSM 3043]MBZ5876869.1 glutathione peroxidase [Chromohalobacter salexigens]MDF9434276.1 glutathione peroxidase [Chromohalobacter israelensis]MDO0946036.1 glutathione peroxidase [Chromohalobacter salexigens]NQY45137.1 glutathione peroxidase [Chromohalobacter sp.]